MGSLPPYDPSEVVHGGTVTGHINSYTGLIDSYVRNVNEQKSANSLREVIHSAGIARAALRLEAS
jgi:hypothetical protein